MLGLLAPALDFAGPGAEPEQSRPDGVTPSLLLVQPGLTCRRHHVDLLSQAWQNSFTRRLKNVDLPIFWGMIVMLRVSE